MREQYERISTYIFKGADAEMINPCKECLVQVNCTAICPDKKNFQIWLKNGIEQYSYGRLATTPHLRKLFNKMRDMQSENSVDMVRIGQRKAMLKSVE